MRPAKASTPLVEASFYRGRKMPNVLGLSPFFLKPHFVVKRRPYQQSVVEPRLRSLWIVQRLKRRSCKAKSIQPQKLRLQRLPNCVLPTAQEKAALKETDAIRKGTNALAAVVKEMLDGGVHEEALCRELALLAGDGVLAIVAGALQVSGHDSITIHSIAKSLRNSQLCKDTRANVAALEKKRKALEKSMEDEKRVTECRKNARATNAAASSIVALIMLLKALLIESPKSTKNS